MNKKNDTMTLPSLLIRQSMLNSKSSLRKDGKNVSCQILMKTKTLFLHIY